MSHAAISVLIVTLLAVATGCQGPVVATSVEVSSPFPGYPSYEEVVRFHGHSCPGSMMGYRMAIAGMDAVEAAGIDPNEICALVENNNCGTDALQLVSSCTFGKKRIFFDDYGKNVYTFFSRKTKKGFRVSLHLDGVPDEVKADRDAFTAYLLEAPAEDILTVAETTVDVTIPTQTREAAVCSVCGESVNKYRTVRSGDGVTCIPCGR